MVANQIEKDIKMRPTWRDRYILPLESMDSIREKYCSLNVYSYTFFNKNVRSGINIDYRHTEEFCSFNNKNNGLTNSNIRYCPVCIKAAYHSVLHQWKIYDRCFIHGCKLKETHYQYPLSSSKEGKCPIDYAQIPEQCIDNDRFLEEMRPVIESIIQNYRGVEYVYLISYIEKCNNNVKKLLLNNKLSKSKLSNGKCIISLNPEEESVKEANNCLIKKIIKEVSDFFSQEDDNIDALLKSKLNMVDGTLFLERTFKYIFFGDIAVEFYRMFYDGEESSWRVLVDKYNAGDRGYNTINKISSLISLSLLTDNQYKIYDKEMIYTSIFRSMGNYRFFKLVSGINYCQIEDSIMALASNYRQKMAIGFLLRNAIYKSMAYSIRKKLFKYYSNG